MYPNVGNMIAVLMTKQMEIISKIQVCFISWMNFDYNEMVERKAFITNPKHQDRISQCREHDCNGNDKRMEIIMGIQAYLI